MNDRSASPPAVGFQAASTAISIMCSALPLLLALIVACGSAASAQDMEPRAYSRAPVGTQYVLFTYAHQSGDVLTDSTLPLRDVSVRLNSAVFAYGRVFNLAGRQANVAVLVPYIKGSVNGTVFEEQ